MSPAIISCFMLLQFVLVCKSEYIFINSSKSLDKWLEHHRWWPNTSVHLELDSSVEYELFQYSRFSYLINVNMTIVSHSSQVAHIYCAARNAGPNSYQPTRGIAFVNSTVTLQRLCFHSCGMYLQNLPKEITETLNNPNHYFYYSSTHAAAFLLVKSKLLSSFVSFDSSFGFAMIGHNLINSSFVHNNVYHSVKLNKSDTWISFGSGIILYFSKVNPSLTSTSVSFSQTTFKNNFDVSSGHSNCLDPRYMQITSHTRIPIPNAAGLTVLFTRQNAHVTIDQGTFSHNVGSEGYGAMMILNLQNSSTSTTLVTNTLYEKNGKFCHKTYDCHDCHGDSLQFFWYWNSNANHLRNLKLITLRNTTFNYHKNGIWKNRKYATHGAVFIGAYAQNVTTIFTIHEFTCNDNSVQMGDHCLTVVLGTKYSSSSVKVIMTDTTVLNNYQRNPKQLFNFQNIKKVVFAKNSTFKNNFGSAIYGSDSSFYLYGRMIFINNTGLNGGGLNIEGYCSYLNLMHGLKAEFIDNKAYLSGGAIYINSNSYTKCGLQTTGNSIKVSFNGNSANTAGNSLFVSPIYRCFNNRTYHHYWKSFYYHLFNLSTDEVNMPLQLSTFPTRFYAHIQVPEYPAQVYPGQIFGLLCYTEDQKKRNVFSLVNVEVYKFGTNKSIRIWLTQFGGNQVQENIDGTIFNLSVHTNSKTQRDAILSLSVPNLYKKVLNIVLRPCPLGFTHAVASGSCECSAVFNKIPGTSCFIDNKIIKKPAYKNIWVGSISTSSGTVLALSKSCPFTYCTYEPSYTNIKSTDDGLVLTNSANQVKPYCLHNRTGVLCGKCDPRHNYSVVFGTSECSKCSNMWLFTILVYAVVGVVLIVLIFTLNLTLTSGKINGIVFYAQVADAGLLEWLSLPYNGSNLVLGKLHQCCFILLSFLNLNLGFPLCFYNGMNQLWKTGLSLVFPVYLLSVVCTIIILSHYSTWLSNKTSRNSVQVLVTVVHLSFSKLLLTFIDVFTPGTVYTSDVTMKVWYWDGSHQYMEKSHLLLAVVTTATVCLFIIPYIAVLLLGKLMIQCTKGTKLYLRPVLEAAQAPYKEGKEYWFVARLLLLIIIYILYVFFRTSDSIILYRGIASLLALFLIGHALFQPFKSKALALLEYWLMLNITMVYVTLRTNVLPMTNVFTLTAVLLALATFVVCLVFQISQIVINSFFPQNTLNKLKSLFNFRKWTKYNREQAVHLLNTDSYYESCNEYREPLITDED